MTRVLALDVGTSSARARIYEADGTVARDEIAQTRYEVIHGRGGRAELDADHIVEATRAAIASVVQPGEEVSAVATSCFWHSLLLVDRRGRAASPLYIWQDTRSAGAADALARRLDGTAVHARTGCALHPSYWPAKLAWLREAELERCRDAARFTCFSEYLYERLTGEPRMSVSMASATGLLDVQAKRWDAELLEALGLEPGRLPAISDEPAGDREPWFPARGDGACSNVGAGCRTRTRATLMVGTSGAFRVLHDGPRGPFRPELFCYRLDDRHLVEGGSLSDGGNLYAWLSRTIRLPGPLDVSERDADAHGLTFLPLLGGERSIGWHGDARGAIAGLTFDTSPKDLLQAALEGVAYRFAEIADAMPEARAVVATGGGLLADPGWVQVLADVLERSVELSPVPETSARGAAVLALERLGEAPPPPPRGRVFEPRPDRAETYRSARQRQRDLYEKVT